LIMPSASTRSFSPIPISKVIVCPTPLQAMPWIRWLVAGLPTTEDRVQSHASLCGDWGGQIVLGQVFLWLHQFFPVDVIPPVIHTHSIIYHRCYTILAIDSIIKWQRGKVVLCMISGFCHCVNEIFTLLGCYMAQIVVIYRRFGTTYQSHLERSSWTAWPLKMGLISCPWTSVINY
jgi:hypothetical protein